MEEVIKLLHSRYERQKIFVVCDSVAAILVEDEAEAGLTDSEHAHKVVTTNVPRHTAQALGDLGVELQRGYGLHKPTAGETYWLWEPGVHTGRTCTWLLLLDSRGGTSCTKGTSNSFG